MANPVLMVFLDGVGIGKKDFEFNPFFKYGFKTFEKIFGQIPSVNQQKIDNGSTFLFPCNATLGVAGLPQSGTGQVSLFCGVNAPKIVGKHFGPYPYSTTYDILKEKSLMVQYKKLGLKSYFVNAYPKVFFDYLKSGKTRLGVTALTCKFAGIKFNSVEDVKKGNAITAELTNERWNKKLGYKLKVIKPENAANRLLKIAQQNDFTLYEYYLTDHLGHKRLADEFDKIFREVDEFLFELLTNPLKDKLTVIVCSDHGNLEDLSVKTHTLNPAITITAGKHAKEIAGSIKNLTDVKKSILKFCL